MDSTQFLLTVLAICITIAVAAITLGINSWIRAMPSIDVRLENPTQPSDSTVTLIFHFENIGKKPFNVGPLKTAPVHSLSIMTYFSRDFEIIDSERQKVIFQRTFDSSQKGKLANMRYTFVADAFGREPPVIGRLRHTEVESARIRVKTPKIKGSYPVYVDMCSGDQDLELSTVYVNVV